MTENYYYNDNDQMVLSESELREQYLAITAADDNDHETFDNYLEISCKQDLHKIPHNASMGDDSNYDVDAATQFSSLLDAMCRSGETVGSIQVVVNGYSLQAPNTASLLQSLQQAIEDYADDIR